MQILQLYSQNLLAIKGPFLTYSWKWFLLGDYCAITYWINDYFSRNFETSTHNRFFISYYNEIYILLFFLRSIHTDERKKRKKLLFGNSRCFQSVIFKKVCSFQNTWKSSEYYEFICMPFNFYRTRLLGYINLV